MADEEEVVEGEEAQPAATEFVPEQSAKPKSNVYSVLLILTFCAFFAGCWLAGNEAWTNYDVTFFGVFSKQPGRSAEPGGSGGGAAQPETPPSKETSTPPPSGDKK